MMLKNTRKPQAMSEGGGMLCEQEDVDDPVCGVARNFTNSNFGPQNEE